MFAKADKRRLYWLIDQFLNKKIDAPTFCNEYYDCYDLELGFGTLKNNEARVFFDLSQVVNRFSEFEEDHQGLPGGFFTEEELMQKVIETKKLLQLEYLIMQRKNSYYGVKDASNDTMLWFLVDFLTDDVGYDGVSSWKNWLKNPDYDSTVSNATRVKKDGNIVLLYDASEKFTDSHLTISQENLLNILDQWEKVYAEQPNEIVIYKEADDFIIEGKNKNCD
jgi:hypothetical protein